MEGLGQLKKQIFSSTPSFQTLSVHVPPLLSETKFHIYTKNRQNYSFAYSNVYVSGEQREDRRFRNESQKKIREPTA
jgi:hypothetical protein